MLDYECAHENMASSRGAKKRQPSVGTEGDEMQVPCA